MLLKLYLTIEMTTYSTMDTSQKKWRLTRLWVKESWNPSMSHMLGGWKETRAVNLCNSTKTNSTWICSEVHWSRLTDFTLDMCTPRFLWMPAHRMQINTPRFQDAHLGPEKGRTVDCNLAKAWTLQKNTNMHDLVETSGANKRLCALYRGPSMKTKLTFF